MLTKLVCRWYLPVNVLFGCVPCAACCFTRHVRVLRNVALSSQPLCTQRMLVSYCLLAVAG